MGDGSRLSVWKASRTLEYLGCISVEDGGTEAKVFKMVGEEVEGLMELWRISRKVEMRVEGLVKFGGR